MITYLKGDATEPMGEDMKLIAHICNDIGAWGAGFVMALSKKWPEAEQAYRDWHTSVIDVLPFELGEVQPVRVEENITVCNMIAQHETIRTNSRPLDYGALAKCLYIVRSFALSDQKASVHMPRIGCGLAGGSWDKVEPLIENALSDINVFVYDL